MKKLLSLLLVGMLLFPGAARAAQGPFTRYTQDYFGTVSMLCLYETAGAQDTWQEVKALLQSIEEAVSVSDPQSDIARFNALKSGESLVISDLTQEILSIAFAAYALTDGLYDPTVFPLVDLWGFSPRFNQGAYRPLLPYDRPYREGQMTPAAEADVAALLPLVGLSGLEMRQTPAGWELIKHTPSVSLAGVTLEAQIDLGGLAKGYACDRVAALLREKGYTAGYFVCGGSSMAFLAMPEGRAFSVTAGKPRTGGKGEFYAELQAKDTTLSSSSDASHSYTDQGVLYCHIMDPRTGFPLNRPDGEGIQRGAATVTLLGESAAMNDALSTALCLMGPQKALDFLQLRQERMVMAVYKTGESTLEVVSNLPREAVEILDESYRWACETDAQGRVVYTGAWAP